VRARVGDGIEVVMGDEVRCVAVVRPAEPHVRLLSESLRLAKEHASTATLGDRVEQFIEKIVKATGDQEAALSAIGVTELIHGIYRAQTPEIRLRRR